MRYQVLTAGKRTEITDLENKVRIAVFEQDKKVSASRTTYCLATQYQVKGGFVPQRIFVFQTVAVIELALVKQAMDFFFTTLLDTELYVKEVPRDFAFFPQEPAKLFGNPILAA
ncbi:hypothetical protein [Mucilaginibacter auburnensis]|uniref:Uncharacterized protein n=1 Tax=Mucilaginibacter auburnensis TaxID=1457233 RepID=A0A2H9VLS8_9SPHI|nr:hypothetical protein [Mucilaginibacter auburnensis]PJJ79273.1 hypothetical protein CLV57_2402 [Mucilaginibacter auburnensis]